MKLTIEERLNMPRIPWRSFTNAELEMIGGAAYLRGDTKMLTAVRRVTSFRDRDPRPYASDTPERAVQEITPAGPQR